MPFIHFLLFPIAALGGNKRIKNFSISTSINTLKATATIICQVCASISTVPIKVETFAVEGYNGLFRHFLAKLRRESKCSKNATKLTTH